MSEAPNYTWLCSKCHKPGLVTTTEPGTRFRDWVVVSCSHCNYSGRYPGDYKGATWPGITTEYRDPSGELRRVTPTESGGWLEFECLKCVDHNGFTVWHWSPHLTPDDTRPTPHPERAVRSIRIPIATDAEDSEEDEFWRPFLK